MDTIDYLPQPKFGKEFCWHADRRAVYLSCTLNRGKGKQLQIYILEETLMDAGRLTDKPSTDKLEELAKNLWNTHQIQPAVVRRINAGASAWGPDGSIEITARELREQRQPGPDFSVRTPRPPRI
jgi:hypothetical protein